MLGLSSAISVCRPPISFREGGGGPPTFGGRRPPKSGLSRAEGARFTKIFENLNIFEKSLLKNAIKMIFGDPLKKFFLNFLCE